MPPTKLMNDIPHKDQYADYTEWADSWEEISGDVEIGNRILLAMAPFIAEITKSKLTKKTIQKHINNIWQLGGEIISRMNRGDEENKTLEGKAILLKYIDEYEGPYCHHLNSEEAMRSFDSTCKKLYKCTTR